MDHPVIVGGYPIPWIAILLSRSVFEQENLFRQSEQANWEIEQRKATDQLQQQVLQTTRLESDYHIIQLSAAAEVSRVTGGILDPDELMYQVVEMTRERFGLYLCGPVSGGKERRPLEWSPKMGCVASRYKRNR